MAVGDALRRTGIRGVLTGGACASLYTADAYASVDVDIVITGDCELEALDAALASLGFARRGDRYVHAAVPFFVEFPRGPLGIGDDFAIRPVLRSHRGAKTLALSATDACRDRLAAFYHWNDLQSLAVAVAIAAKQRVDLRKVRDWSLAEGRREGHAAFMARLTEARRPRGKRTRRPRGRALEMQKEAEPPTATR